MNYAPSQVFIDYKFTSYFHKYFKPKSTIFSFSYFLHMMNEKGIQNISKACMCDYRVCALKISVNYFSFQISWIIIILIEKFFFTYQAKEILKVCLMSPDL